jgi:peptidoglycan lytic transglycosylase
VAIKKQKSTIRILLLLAGLFLAIVAFWLWWSDRADHSQDVPILAAARRYGLEPALIKAVVWRESRFNPAVRGNAGELGLMQLQEPAAQEWADAEHLTNFEHITCLDPGTNTMAGTWYLRKLIRRYRQTDDPLPYALADYNAGRGNVLKWNKGSAQTNPAIFIDQIGFPTTKIYVKEVLQRYHHYRPIFGPQSARKEK